MRAHEFITEDMPAEYTVPEWLAMATERIHKLIDSGEIPNNPDSIRAASKQLAMDNCHNIEGLDGVTIADEIEHQIVNNKIAKKAHLSGDYGE